MKNRNDVVEIDLIQLAKALWHRAWAIILSTVLVGILAFSYTYFLVTPMYKSTAMLYVNNSSISVGSTSVSLSDLSASQSLVETYAVILKTRTMLNAVIEETGVDYTYSELYNMVSTGAVNETEVFYVTVTSADPAEAELLANAIAELLPEKIADVVEGSSVRIVDYAVVPSQKSSPNVTRNTAMGMLIGFALCCGVIILIELMDEQIRDEEYLLQTYDIPILAAVPDLLGSKSNKNYYYNSYSSNAKEAM